MAVANSGIYQQTYDEAGLRLWGKNLEDTLVAAGLTKVSSTIDWATVSYPLSQVSVGVTVFRLGDTLSATKEVYIEIGFGRGGTSVAYGFKLEVRVSDSASFDSPVASTYSQCVGAVTNAQWNVCYDEGGFIAVQDADNSYTKPVIVVERSRDSDGTYTLDGVSAMTRGNNHDSTSTSANYAFGYAAIDWTRGSVTTPSASTDVYCVPIQGLGTWGGATSVQPIIRQFGSVVGPMKFLAGITGVSAGSEIEVTELSGVGTYRNSLYSPGSQVVPGSTYFLYRYE